MPKSLAIMVRGEILEPKRSKHEDPGFRRRRDNNEVSGTKKEFANPIGWAILGCRFGIGQVDQIALLASVH